LVIVKTDFESNRVGSTAFQIKLEFASVKILDAVFLDKNLFAVGTEKLLEQCI
jgi:hypothetical protein